MLELRRFWVAGAAVAVVLVFLLTLLIVRLGSEEAVKDSKIVVAATVPNDLTLKLDGERINATGETAVTAGDHVLEASRRGFATETKTVRVASRQIVSLSFYLEANSAEGEEWYRKHPEAAREAEGARSRAFDDLNKRLREKYPIIAKLPVVGPQFRIDYGSSKQEPNNPEKIALYIQAVPPKGRENALTWMRANGFKPADFEIVYTTPTPGKWIYPSSR